MYSVLLMAAMTTGTAEAPSFHLRSFGCTGGMYLHTGCYGSCIGAMGWDAFAGNGGCQGCHGGCWGVSACYGGCYGCMGCYGVSYTSAGNPMMAPAATPQTGTPPAATPPAGSGTPTPGTQKAAQLIIEKPADAKLFVDNLPVKSEGTTQTFSTPVLDPRQAYYYVVRVETVRDGKPQAESRRVIVRAGQTVQESFRDPGVATASLKVTGAR